MLSPAQFTKSVIYDFAKERINTSYLIVNYEKKINWLLEHK